MSDAAEQSDRPRRMTMAELMQSPFGRAHRRLHNVWMHDVTDRLRLRRRAIARADGLDPNDVEHYPTSGDTIVVEGGRAGWLTGALASAMLMAIGALAGIVGWQQWQPAGVPDGAEYKVEFFTQGGEPIPIQPTPTPTSGTERESRGETPR